MSYEKKTIGVEPNDVKVIRFYYITDNIFNLVSEATSFKAASVIREKDGHADFDRLQISSDEKTFMKKYLKEAILEVFSTMFKIISGDSVIHDVSITLENSSDVVASYADIVDNSRYRNINLDLIDQLVNNSLVDFIMFKWYALKGLSSDAEMHNLMFRNNLSRIVEKTLALRQPA